MKTRRHGSLGEFLVLKLDSTRWSASFERVIRRLAPAGVFLDAAGSPGATAELLARVARLLDHPPLFWITAEGGSAGGLGGCFPELPAVRAAAARGLEAVEQLGELVGSALGLIGFNVNCAPRLDLLDESAPANRGDVSGKVKPAAAPWFGSEPKQVAAASKAFVRGLRGHKILACGRHFPGLGEREPAAEPGVIGKSMTELWHRDLVPYREVLPKLFAVMMSPAAYKAYDFDIPRPAWRSGNVIQGLLRIKLGYGGLAVADLTRPVAGAGPADLVVRSIAAGCDLAIVEAGEGEAVLAGLERAWESGSLAPGRLDESFERLRAARRGVLPPPGRVKKADLDRMARQFEEFSKASASEVC